MSGVDPNEVRFFSGSSNPQLAADIADYLGVSLEETRITRFSNDNLYIQLMASMRSRSVFLVQSLAPPVNDHLVELLMMLDIARSAAAKEIHALIPYYSFARSDKKDAPRISITARLVADLLQTAGATHVMSMMLHSPQVHGFFGVPTDPLTPRPVFDEYFRTRDLSSTIVVAPDVGHMKSAARFAHGLGLPVAAGNKERLSDTKVAISGLIGHQVKGHRKALIYDDEIATGSSVIELSELLVEHGVEEIWAVCTHGVFVGRALEKLAAVPQITDIVTTDTVYLPPEKRPSNLHILSVAWVFGEAIRCNYERRSIGELFVFGDEAQHDN
ncbi:MAG TPA: ribose-phosphate pyrophosphokinase [Anaerolineae bacterium]|nr:ribose-phosphate pyrophosphokinase [Anaerolineae bacterium]